jgi:class 3 adenylate cyclase
VEALIRRVYERLGPRYLAAYRVVHLVSAAVLCLAAAWVFTLYVNVSTGELMQLVAVAEVALLATLGWSTFLWTRAGRPVERWLQGDRRAERATAAWRAAVALPAAGLRITVWRAIVLAAVPVAVYAGLAFDLSLATTLVLLVAMLAGAAYPTVLNYFALELYLRPVLHDLARQLPRGFEPPARGFVPLRLKLLATLPLINLVTGLFVAIFAAGPKTSLDQLGADVLVAGAVAFSVSLVLTALVTRSLLTPMGELIEATRRVRSGDMDARVPVASNDELGVLAGSFNEMLERVGERELLRVALGSYAAPDVLRRVMAERSPQLAGDEFEVTMMLVDIRDFTSYSERATPAEAVAYLNGFFDLALPIVLRHGGHANKFVGDGLLAVFGTPEPVTDHADRALRAGLELVDRVAEVYGETLRVGVGLNSGRVLAGTVGGGGRYEFMLIGDPVNVTARVERVTRDTGDVLLLSQATAELLADGDLRARLRPRGQIRLKGKSEPVALFAAGPAATALGARTLEGFSGELTPVRDAFRAD